MTDQQRADILQTARNTTWSPRRSYNGYFWWLSANGGIGLAIVKRVIGLPLPEANIHATYHRHMPSISLPACVILGPSAGCHSRI
ncbi:hypothetical protein ACT691_05685 [Vibrio metschnikovii]